ncbi:hypothetical protein AAGG74_16300 [Bacillus mexicanus]|uniref:hypothetical protein n=1 Tax=Bacillus mexicanus TaxID=2834415 RepID=UPI003D1D5A5D
MNNIVIVINDGSIEEVLTDKNKLPVTVIDKDIEGLDEEQISLVDEEECYVWNGIKETEVKPDKVEKIFEESSRTLLENNEEKMRDYTIELYLQKYLDLQGVELTEQQKEEAKNGIKYWFQNTIGDALSDSVQSVIK